MINKHLFTSGNNEYNTPSEILNYFGPFDLDLCCNESNKVCENGCYNMYELNTKKIYGRVWCNPPYSTKLQNDSVDICLNLADNYNEVYMLIPCRMNSKRFSKIIESGLCTDIYFPDHRVRFNGIGSAPFDCMILRLCRNFTDTSIHIMRF